jgi:ABC-2 type transport system permease protein
MEKDTFRMARKELVRPFFVADRVDLHGGLFGRHACLRFFGWRPSFPATLPTCAPCLNGCRSLLIFLMSAVTMRMWSEERRMGTLEYLMTMPVKRVGLVFGKFLACWGWRWPASP